MQQSLSAHGMHAHRVIVFNLSAKNEDVIVEQHLPLGDAFFDPFELGRLLPANTWSLEGNMPIDLESPVIKGAPMPHFLRLRISAGTSGTIKLPMHARYPIPSSHKKENGKLPERYQVFVPSIQLSHANPELVSIDATNSCSDWSIPTGMIDDFYVVQLLIVALLCMALIIIVRALLRKSKSMKN